MAIKKVMIVGSGTLGGQIGFQCAAHGFEVVMFDVTQEALDACKKSHEAYGEIFQEELDYSKKDIDATMKRLTYSTDMAEAAKGVDLVSESVPENMEIKKKTYEALSQHCGKDTIFTTNTSTLLPSDLVGFTDRPEKFLALHFANQIWHANIAEIMPHPKTDKKIVKEVTEFSVEMGMVPISINKEQNGYVINSLLVPWLVAGQSLVTQEVATFEDVDRTWMISTGMMQGPFGIMDMIGLETVYSVFDHWGQALGDQAMQANAQYLKKNFVDKKNLGMKTGKGYYSYPTPKYIEESFLRGK